MTKNFKIRFPRLELHDKYLTNMEIVEENHI